MSCSSPVPSSTNTARFGFTVTKQLGKAVVRNKIRRRLKEAVRAIAPANTLPDLDYVIIARQPSLDRPFERLKQDLADALVKVNRTPAAKSSYRPHKARIEAKPAATPPQRGNSESASNPAHGLIKDGLVQGQTVRERKGAKEPS